MEKCIDYRKCVKGRTNCNKCSNCELRDLSDLDERFTRYYKSGQRVEVTNKEGFGDYTGYGCLTDGKKNRFYVGISTGRKPIYLMILRVDSTGGGSICSEGIESVRGLNKYNR